MAGKIMGGKPAAQVVDRINSVLGVTEAKLYALSMSDDRGQRSVITVLVFGKLQDEKPGVFVFLNDVEMQEKLRIANADVRDAVLRALSETDAVEPSDVPSHLLGGAIPGLASGKKGKASRG